MHNAEALLATIREHPDLDGPRLVYADWLEERGDPRGEFIRVQLELAVVSPGPRTFEGTSISFRKNTVEFLATVNESDVMPRVGERINMKPEDGYPHMVKMKKLFHRLLVTGKTPDAVGGGCRTSMIDTIIDEQSVPWPGIELAVRERALLDAYALDWTKPMLGAIGESTRWWIPDQMLVLFNGGMETTFRRGFPVVRCRLEDWYEECEQCHGRGRYNFHYTGVPCEDDCPKCYGTGNVGHGPALLAAAGAIDGVDVSDREPNRGGDYEWRWFRGRNRHGVHPASDLPEAVFDLLKGGTIGDMGHKYMRFDSADAARRALSRALLLYADEPSAYERV